MKKLLIPILVMVLALGIAIPVSANGPYDLIADGRDEALDVGSVTVAQSGSDLIVTIATDYLDYELVETHVHVAMSYLDLPQTGSGNPKVGHFDYSSEHDPMAGDVTSKQYTIPLSSYGLTYVAVHADVYSATSLIPGTIDEYGRYETAWVDGDDFDGRNWAMYITFVTTAP